MSPLTNEDKRFLLRLARSSVEASVRGETMEVPAAVSPALQEPAGAFVTLHWKTQLRGCVGSVLASRPLYQTVIEMAAAAALRDPRFEPVSALELADLEVEISVLSPMSPVRPEEIRVGTQGLMVSQAGHRGLLLPQVAADHHWDHHRFLEETCRKAGLPPDAWRRGAKVETFTAEVFAEHSLEKNT